ncbi:MAG: hypothetical protein Kow0010_04040 [Dehalococcoidia bacterium]
MTNPSLLRWLVTALAVVLALPVAGALAQDGGSVDAGANASMQPITITVSLDAGAHATPRVWNFVVEDGDGRIIDSLAVRTTREAPMASGTTQPLAGGDYVVRLLPSNHVAAACYSGIFYEIASPAGGAAAVTMDGTPKDVAFAFVPCPDNPDELGVEYSTEPGPGVAVPTAGGADAASEATPAPPATGSGLAAPAGGGHGWLAVAGVVLFVFGIGFALAASLTRNKGR